MTQNIEVLNRIIQSCLYFAAFSTTLVPVVYALAPWYQSALGRAFMLQSVSFAAVMDLTVIFQFWTPIDVRVKFWIEAIMFVVIAAATTRIVILMLKIRTRPEDSYYD